MRQTLGLPSLRDRETFMRSLTVALFVVVWAGVAGAAPGASIVGTVRDPLGARVPAAAVAILREGTVIADTTSDSQGRFSFSDVDSGRYRLEIMAAGFEPQAV